MATPRRYASTSARPPRSAQRSGPARGQRRPPAGGRASLPAGAAGRRAIRSAHHHHGTSRRPRAQRTPSYRRRRREHGRRPRGARKTAAAGLRPRRGDDGAGSGEGRRRRARRGRPPRRRAARAPWSASAKAGLVSVRNRAATARPRRYGRTPPRARRRRRDGHQTGNGEPPKTCPLWPDHRRPTRRRARPRGHPGPVPCGFPPRRQRPTPVPRTFAYRASRPICPRKAADNDRAGGRGGGRHATATSATPQAASTRRAGPSPGQSWEEPATPIAAETQRAASPTTAAADAHPERRWPGHEHAGKGPLPPPPIRRERPRSPPATSPSPGAANPPCAIASPRTLWASAVVVKRGRRVPQDNHSDSGQGGRAGDDVTRRGADEQRQQRAVTRRSENKRGPWRRARNNAVTARPAAPSGWRLRRPAAGAGRL